jgi:chorismate mutase
MQNPTWSDGVQHAEELLEQDFQRETSRDDLAQPIIVNLRDLHPKYPSSAIRMIKVFAECLQSL